MMWKKILHGCFLFFMNLTAFGLQETSVLHSVHPEPMYGYWNFSGLMRNESNETFGYFFQVERKNTEFGVHLAVVEASSGNLVLHYRETAKIENALALNWKIGHAFLRFNSINESWVFGLRMPDKSGFNLKANMLGQPLTKKEMQASGVQIQIQQTGSLDGLLQVLPNKAEQFVTAMNAWFIKTAFNPEKTSENTLRMGFCKTMEGEGFYTGSLEQSGKKQNTISGFEKANGHFSKIKPFTLSPTKDAKVWSLQLEALKWNLSIRNSLQGNDTVAGFFQELPKGFCFFNDQSL